MTNAKIKDIGPVEYLEFDIVPGVTELRGQQGCGKTTILHTVELATTGKSTGKVSKRDGTRRGEAEIAGRTLKVSRTTRYEGELEFEGLGEFDISELHSPREKSLAPRERKRIKTLLQLAEAKADPSMFYDLLGGKEQFEQIVDAESLQMDDLVEMSGKVKRAIDKAAQSEETQGTSAAARASTKLGECEGFDLSEIGSLSHDECAAELQKSVSLHASLVSQRQSGEEAKERMEKVCEEIEKSKWDGPSAEEAKETHEKHKGRVSEIEAEIAKLNEKLLSAQALEEVSEKTLQMAESQHAKHESLKLELEKLEGTKVPTDAEISEAAEAKDAAQKNLEKAMKLKDVEAAAKAAEEYQDQANIHKKNAAKLRAAGKEGIQEVLSNAISKIKNCPFHVIVTDDGDARLAMATDRSESEPIEELSDGERWKPILDLAADRPNKIVVLHQAHWGEFQPKVKTEIMEMARERGVCIVTAVADDGELRAVQYQCAA